MKICRCCKRILDESCFWRIHKGYKALLPRCKSCIKARKREKHNPDRAREHHLHSKWKMNELDYQTLFLAQNGVCAICHKAEFRKHWRTGRQFSLHIDHDHKTGKLRGLLCSACNLTLGRMQENVTALQNMIEYIRTNTETKLEIAMSAHARTPRPHLKDRIYRWGASAALKFVREKGYQIVPLNGPRLTHAEVWDENKRCVGFLTESSLNKIKNKNSAEEVHHELKRIAGIYRKFDVRRTDGQSRKGKKHHKCRYFVLDIDHDKYAAAALEAYAKACAKDFPTLAKDLDYYVKTGVWSMS